MNDDVFLTDRDAFIASQLTNGAGNSTPDGALVVSVRPQAGYWTGYVRAKTTAWGWEKVGSNASPAGVTNKYRTEYAMCLSGVNINMQGTPSGASAVLITKGANVGSGAIPLRGVFEDFINNLARDARSGCVLAPHGLSGATGWRVRVRWRAHNPASGLMMQVWLARASATGAQRTQWLTDNDNDGVAEYQNDTTGISGAPVAMQVTGPVGTDWIEKIFVTNAEYSYDLINLYASLRVQPFDVPQQPIAETTTEAFVNVAPPPFPPEFEWVDQPSTNSTSYPVWDFEAFFYRRARMLCMYLVTYGSIQLTSQLPPQTLAAAGFSYNSTATTALANAITTHGVNRVLTQWIGQPLDTVAPSWWVDFIDASATSNNKIAWLWNFGDGTTATTANARRYYANCGVYVTSLTVTDEAGDVFNSGVNYRVLVIVPHALIASYNHSSVTKRRFFSPEWLYANYTTDVGFSNNPLVTQWGGPGATYLWNFGDGTTSTSKFPVKLYSAATNGQVTVSVTVTAANGMAVTHTTSVLVS